MFPFSHSLFEYPISQIFGTPNRYTRKWLTNIMNYYMYRYKEYYVLVKGSFIIYKRSKVQLVKSTHEILYYIKLLSRKFIILII